MNSSHAGRSLLVAREVEATTALLDPLAEPRTVALPSLPSALRRKLDDALARPAAQQPDWPNPEQTKMARTVL
ncbi:hypothetical protein, partial [Kutzneria sp. NPDC051319]|uniref:hypothetical protein n=1 Tax=Kutzneria sp. NPDC051319 TaxID=3155047 RepID=UPI003418CDB2